MNTPRDNYNLFTVYLNAGYTIEACDLLYKGMKNGTIESKPENWKILGSYYQQANKELQAIAALKEAAKLFPKDGSIEVLLGQIYQQMDKTKEAHDAYARGVAKGNLGEHPHQALLYLAYTALELEDYDGALKAIGEAEKLPGGSKDPQVKSLKAGIEATIQEREAQKNASKKL
jgi:tetratricopeptide (TPR) repeat protein